MKKPREKFRENFMSGEQAKNLSMEKGKHRESKGKPSSEEKQEKVMEIKGRWLDGR